MSQQSSPEAKQAAEQEIFELLKEIDLYTIAGDVGRCSRLRIRIAQLQRDHGAVTGIERIQNDRTA